MLQYSKLIILCKGVQQKVYKMMVHSLYEMNHAKHVSDESIVCFLTLPMGGLDVQSSALSDHIMSDFLS